MYDRPRFDAQTMVVHAQLLVVHAQTMSVDDQRVVVHAQLLVVHAQTMSVDDQRVVVHAQLLVVHAQLLVVHAQLLVVEIPRIRNIVGPRSRHADISTTQRNVTLIRGSVPDGGEHCVPVAGQVRSLHESISFPSPSAHRLAARHSCLQRRQQPAALHGRLLQSAAGLHGGHGPRWPR
jgi:hypothetical protein